MTSRFLGNALILGLISAIGPFAIDMYLPALPSIGQALGADAAAVQLSLIAFFVPLGLCQLVFGPLSDSFGRKAPLYFGLAVFSAGSVGCALAPDIETLVAFRFVQGIGACAGMVVPRAVVRDLHTGVDAAQMMSLLMLVFSVSPILAPLTGSAVIALASWRAVFWVIAGAGVLGLVLVAVFLKETRPPGQRSGGAKGVLAAYRVLLGDRTFLGLALIGGFGIASFFTYLGSASFVLIDHFGLSPTSFSVLFALNAVAFIGAAQMNGWLGRRFGMRRLVRTGAFGSAAAMLVLLAITAAGVDRLDVLMALLFVSNGFLGLVIPNSAVLALEDHGAIAGTASALMGTLHLLVGAAAIAIAGAFFDGTPLPMVAGMAACTVATLILAQLTLGPARVLAAAE